ncbi:MAG: VCBS repeat-containing protein [Acidobacteria bacterium]|nr:VCBS repeat-containing protein [Acidobacteriota bacterium]
MRLANAKPLTFRHETIDADPPGAQHAIALVADLNADGRPDVIVGCKRGSANLFWYENPSWARHDMAAAPNLEAGGLVFDVNGDGRPDVVAGQQAGGRELYWFECPADPKGPWSKHVLENRFEQYQGLAAADVDADGKTELVVLAPRSGVLVYYDVPDDPRVSPWPPSCMYEVAKGLEGVEGLAVLDTDGDKQVEIIAGTTLYRRLPKDGTWKGESFAADYKTPRVAGADLDGDSRVELVVCESGVSRGRLAWCKPPSWTPHPLRDDLFHASSLAVTDFDGDGLPDIFVGESGLGRNEAPRLLLYRNLGRGRFDETVISRGIPTHEAKVADLNGDGKPDIVGKPYEPERHVDVWFNGG